MTDTVPLLDVSSYQNRRNYKVAIISLGALLGLATLYLLTVYLPSLFLPESTPLHPIVTFKELDRSFMVHENSSLDFSQSSHAPKHSDDEYTNAPMERLIIIGDIHGSYRQLRKLLKKVRYRTGRDHIFALGDAITKGPDSLAVLDFLIENNASCILGNHEYYVLNHYAKYHHIKFPGFINPAGEAITDLPKLESSRHSDSEFRLAKKLQPHHVKYINKCPVIQSLGSVPLYKQSKQDVSKGAWSTESVSGVAVHAGIQWERPLEAQSPIDNLEMRSLLSPDYTQPTKDADTTDAVSWSKVFNLKQKDKPESEALVVYYGHEASRGINLKRFTKGLDSGCVGGGKLLAMVLWKSHGAHDGEIEHWEQLFSVKC